MMTWNLINFPDANSPIMEQLIFFHNHSMIIIVSIILFISYFMYNMVSNKFMCLYIQEGQDIETVWTIIPMVLLIFIAIPSLRLLYFMEENFNPVLSIKIVGHQWYWAYEYSNFNFEFNSFITPFSEMKHKNFRLLEVDNRTVIPFNTPIRFLITSEDVVHAWTLPSLGVKMDAMPGRLNQINVYSARPGLFFGQCSEICGANHSFMPIMVEATTMKMFFSWVKAIK